MDWTTLQHSLIVVVFTCIGWMSGDVIAGYLAGATLVIVREHTQAEYRWVERYGNGLRANMPWWGGFDYVVWNYSSLADWLAPALACAVLLGCSYCF